jgi:hypothetical protein
MKLCGLAADFVQILAQILFLCKKINGGDVERGFHTRLSPLKK